MSTHKVVATPQEEAHLRQVLDAWQAERGLSRTGLSVLLVGTDLPLSFWNARRRLSQPLLNRLFIGCKAAGIPATLDTLLGVRQPIPQAPLSLDAAEPDTVALCDRPLLQNVIARIECLEKTYHAMNLVTRMEYMLQYHALVMDRLKGVEDKTASLFISLGKEVQ